MTYPLGSQPAIHVNYCPLASVGWLVISGEITHWLAGHSLKKLLHGVLGSPLFAVEFAPFKS